MRVIYFLVSRHVGDLLHALLLGNLVVVIFRACLNSKNAQEIITKNSQNDGLFPVKLSFFAQDRAAPLPRARLKIA